MHTRTKTHTPYPRSASRTRICTYVFTLTVNAWAATHRKCCTLLLRHATSNRAVKGSRRYRITTLPRDSLWKGLRLGEEGRKKRNKGRKICLSLKFHILLILAGVLYKIFGYVFTAEQFYMGRNAAWPVQSPHGLLLFVPVLHVIPEGLSSMLSEVFCVLPCL